VNELEFLREAASENGLSRNQTKDADFADALLLRERLLTAGFVQRYGKDHVSMRGGTGLDFFVVVITDAGRKRLAELA